MEKKKFNLENLKKLSREDMKKIKGGTTCYACGSNGSWGFGCPQGGCSCFTC